ncbi:CynX/NimT family MFS transporter [Cyclobacterium marinum]|uniref:Major facilitator superfamily MFS_1 n=1 Tax=Cyclobacterium marinum (strain ATCC 25205 / DSM 745 / LMG 13164 / NCIMB 1802) TaxID=880070 RepID=G0J3L0_CYCMS|nr:MFS transporter [Cyclobacterium marinum]AEL25216.1 major facilitator superfamily MFS_1 [Cyclobacterium marinum DSM 745]
MTFSHNISRLKNKSSNQWLVLGILLVSFNLRPSITAVGPLIPYIREEMSISNGLAGFLTTLPLLSFAIFSLFSAAIGDYFGKAKAIFLGLVVLGIGSIIRVSAGPYMLFFGTALTGIGIVICNVLLIPLVKARMPMKTGAVTGMYSTGMSLMAAIATALSVPLAIDLNWGWRGSLLFWSSLLFLALIVWWPQLKLSPKPKIKPEKPGKSVWRSRLAWQVTLFMGLQSFLFFTLVTWLPDMMIDRGLSPVEAGLTASLMQVVGLSGTFVAPFIAVRYQQQSIFNTIIGLIYVIGFSSLFISILWLNIISIGLIGLGMGASISLAYTLIALRTDGDNYTSALSGMAQSAGYFLAAFGPMLFGVAFDIWQDWDLLIYLMIIASTLFTYFGYHAGKNRTI